MSKALCKKVPERQKEFGREIEKIQIFLDKSLPILKAHQNSYAKTRRKTKSAQKKKKNEDIIAVYEQYCRTGLYETFRVSTVSMFEAFLSDVIRELLLHDPQKIEDSADGVQGTKNIPTNFLWGTDDLAVVMERAVERHVDLAMRTNPQYMFGYISKLARIEFLETVLHQYFEIKATRDALVHNGGIANTQYKNRAAKRARAKSGTKLTVNSIYFGKSLEVIKHLSEAIREGIEGEFAKAD